MCVCVCVMDIVKIIDTEDYWVRIKIDRNCKDSYILIYLGGFFGVILGNILCLVCLLNEGIEKYDFQVYPVTNSSKIKRWIFLVCD